MKPVWLYHENHQPANKTPQTSPNNPQAKEEEEEEDEAASLVDLNDEAINFVAWAGCEGCLANYVMLCWQTGDFHDS